MSMMYHCKPSDVMNITDEYTAFCLDEACCLIAMNIQSKEKPHYKTFDKAKTNGKKAKHYNNFKEFYNQFGGT